MLQKQSTSCLILQYWFKTFLKECTLPAGTNSELSFNLGGVQWIVLCNQEGLKGSSVHKQRHRGELHIEHIMMPFFVTHLGKEQPME